jgi:adenylyl-sulfate kinase
MGALGELLELLHDAHGGVSTFEVEFQDWSRQAPSRTLTVNYSDLGKPEPRWRGAGPWPTTAVSTRRIWLGSPNHLRVEVLEDEALVCLAVRNGARWWRWDAAGVATTGSALPDERGLTTLPPMLAPPLLDVRRLISTMRFEAAGTGERAGRTVLRARALPRWQPPSRGALSYELEFDAEHGTLLRRAAFEDRQCVWAREAREVFYGSQINPECFVFVAPDGPEAQDVHARAATSADQDQPFGPELAGAVGNEGHPVVKVPGPGATVWLTGIPAAGKTTLALAMHRALSRNGLPACVLDGDALRLGLSSDLGLSPSDRAEQARRAGEVAALISQSGIVAIVALVSPYTEARGRARQAHAKVGLQFLEVWVDTPQAVCEQRDPKGLYAAARAGELHGLTGLDAPYEAPEAADLRIAGHNEDPDTAASRIIELLATRLHLVLAPVTTP